MTTMRETKKLQRRHVEYIIYIRDGGVTDPHRVSRRLVVVVVVVVVHAPRVFVILFFSPDIKDR